MKMTPALLATVLALSTCANALAEVRLNVVENYARAADPTVWKGVKADDVPASLVQTVVQRDPRFPYSELFPRAFYQEESFLVCFKSCANADARSGKDALEQQTVYYWLGKFYAMAKERFDLTPTERVGVFTNREVRDPGSSKIMRNNAFFNPADGTLSFLPASSNPLARLLGASKINRSGFDPSVVAHEAGHSLFHALFPNAVNSEIDGFNEGFADYMANILLSDAKVGVVMLRGSTLRDSSSLVDSANEAKIYKPGLEVHDMGERFAAALWKSRQEVRNTDEFDRLMIDAIADAAKNPFATGHSIKKAVLERVTYTYETEVARAIRATWDFFVPGEDRSFTDTSFLRSQLPTGPVFGLRTSVKFPESVSRELGIKDESSRFIYVKSAKTTDRLVAHLVATEDDLVTKPYWLLIDPERGNTLGAWYLDGTPVETSDIEDVAKLSKQMASLGSNMQSFITQAKSFSDLVAGRGDLRLIYKVTRQESQNVLLNIAGTQVPGVSTRLVLSKRLLTRLVPGIPNVRSVTLTTVATNAPMPNWPSLSGQPVIGVGMVLEDGVETETFFEPVSL